MRNQTTHVNQIRLGRFRIIGAQSKSAAAYGHSTRPTENLSPPPPRGSPTGYYTKLLNIVMSSQHQVRERPEKDQSGPSANDSTRSSVTKLSAQDNTKNSLYPKTQRLRNTSAALPNERARSYFPPRPMPCSTCRGNSVEIAVFWVPNITDGYTANQRNTHDAYMASAHHAASQSTHLSGAHQHIHFTPSKNIIAKCRCPYASTA